MKLKTQISEMQTTCTYTQKARAASASPYFTSATWQVKG